MGKEKEYTITRIKGSNNWINKDTDKYTGLLGKWANKIPFWVEHIKSNLTNCYRN